MSHFKSVRVWIALAGLVLWAGTPAARGQSAGATLNGTVRDSSGSAVPGATVAATNTQTGLQRTASTDANGLYTILSLPPGTYDIRASHAGFATVASSNQTFYVGTTPTLNFTLPVATQQTSVQVEASVPVLQTTQSTLSTVVNTEQLDDLPVLSRGFSALAQMTPGVVVTSGGSVEIGNSNSYQTAYNLDGTSIKATLEGGQFQQVAQDWIQEFGVMNSQFSAEYGEASGGYVNAITRSGTNDIHGRLYGFYQNASLNANPWTTTGLAHKLPYTLDREGAMVGGPIKKDKLFYFAGYEYYHNLNTETVSVPATFNGPFDSSGNYANPTTTQLAILKIDYNLSSTNTFNFRMNGESEATDNAGVGGTETLGNSYDLNAYDLSTAAQWTHTFSPTALNEFKFADLFGNDFYVCPLTAAGIPVGNPIGGWAQLTYPNATAGCLPFDNGLNGSRGIEVYEDLSLSRGSHQIKLGGDYEHSSIVQQNRDNLDGQFTFTAINGTSVQFDPTNPATFPISDFEQYSPQPFFRIPDSIWGIYAQDTFQVNSRLTLNMGLRYDLDLGMSDLAKYSLPQYGINPIGTPYDEVQPRMGFSWQPWTSHSGLLVRGGLGVFYDESVLNIPGVYMATTYTPLLPGGQILNVNATRATLNPFCTGNSACASGTVPLAQQQAVEDVLGCALANETLPNFAPLNGTVSCGGNSYTIPALDDVPGTNVPAPTGAANEIDSNIKTPGTVQGTMGVEDQLSSHLFFSADYDFIYGFNQYFYRNININENTLQPINPEFQAINSFGSQSWFRSQHILTQLRYTNRRGDVVQASYTVGTAVGTGSFGVSSRSPVYTDPFDPDVDEGPTPNDLPNVLNISAVKMLPWGLQLNPIIQWQSGSPLTATTTSATPPPGCLSYYNQCYPTGYTYDSLRTAPYFEASARLAEVVHLGESRTLTGFFEAYNLFNNVNYTSYITNVLSAAFDTPTAAATMRQLQIGVRFDF